MAAISTTGGGQAAAQLAWQQLRVQQAKQNAERAEGEARALRSQADAAQRDADVAQESARSLYVKSDQAYGVASQARQGLVAMQTQSQSQVALANTVDQVLERVGVPETVVDTGQSTQQPVVNTSGQVTGQVVNTTA